LAFLGDFGKFFGLGSSEEVLGDVGEAVGTLFGPGGEKLGRYAGEATGRATSSLAGGGTADQPAEQSAVPTPRPQDLLIRQETSRSGSTQQFMPQILGPSGGQRMTQQASLGGFLAPIISAGRSLLSPSGIATGVGVGAATQFLGGNGMDRMKPVLTQSRRNKARVRQLVNFMGIEGAANFLSQSSGRNISGNDVVQLLLRTFRNDGAYITKAQVRNLRRTTNRFKSLEKQVKEATSMARTTRRPAMRRASSTTLIKN
jgi:hypothetical protein